MLQVCQKTHNSVQAVVFMIHSIPPQLFTAAPPLVMGIFDRSCSAETRMKYPELYRESQSGSHFNWKVRGKPQTGEKIYNAMK